MYLALTTFVICKSLKNDYLNVTIPPKSFKANICPVPTGRKLSCVHQAKEKEQKQRNSSYSSCPQGAFILVEEGRAPLYKALNDNNIRIQQTTQASKYLLNT